MLARSKKTSTSDNQPSGAGEHAMLRPSDPEAGELLDLANRARQLAPWQLIADTDLIGIEHPGTRDIGFISVMGNLGEYEAIALYLGAEGFYGFIDFLNDEHATPDRLLELPHLQAAFSERKYLEKADRDLIKQSGRKVAGAGAWPMFRSYRPGYLPWFVTLAEARFLIHALSQILDITTRLRDEVQPFHPTGRFDENGFPMRVSRQTESGLIWEDQVWQIPRPRISTIRPVIDEVMIEQLERIPPGELELEVDFFLGPGRINKRGQRPQALYMLMVADRESGLIFGIDAMIAENSLADMRATIPNVLAKMLLQNHVVPRRVVVRAEWLRRLLRTLTQSLNIELRHANELPSIDQAVDSMSEWMQRGKF
jgi:hypothetical protein